ncbi:MAG: enoyl-CoA hydratase/isomerase family protein [Nitrospinota bacterium]
MEFREVLYEAHAPFVTLTLNRPQSENKMTPTLARELTQALVALREDDDVRAVILTGAEEHFSTGADVALLSELGPKGFIDFAGLWITFLKTIPTLGKPLIAGVNGDALAGGAAIVVACDLAIAADTARIGNNEATFGLWPMTSKIPVLRQLGQKRALEHFYTGRPFTAEEAKVLGLVNRVVRKADLKASLRAYAEEVTVIPAPALKMGREAYFQMVDLDYASALDLGRLAFITMLATREK